MKNTIKQIINTADKYSDEYAEAIYQLISNVRYAKGYRFRQSTWDDARQDIITKLYEKVIPALNGKNDYAVLWHKVNHLLIDKIRSITAYEAKHQPLNEDAEGNILDKPLNKEWSVQDAIDSLNEVLKGELTPLERKRALKLLNDYEKDLTK